jgi:pyruvate,water dikinase
MLRAPTPASFYGPPLVRTPIARARVARNVAPMTSMNISAPSFARPDLVPTRALCELSSDDVLYAGGEGASLGQLARTGLPVPPGFVIGAPAYAAFRQQTGLVERLAALLSDLDVEDGARLEQASEEARRAISETPIPSWLEDAILMGHARTIGDGSDAVVVISSTTAEDAAAASFTAMDEIVLNVSGRDGVLHAVRRCWQSLFDARVIRLRAQRGTDRSDMDIAVVIRRQIRSNCSGVMFTVDPAGGDRDQLVIEASFGHGEAAISGRVCSDRYVVDKAHMTVVTRSERAKDALDDDQVLRLAELGIAIEREYGAPQDTQWAFDPDGAIWMLQSRPITMRASPS